VLGLIRYAIRLQTPQGAVFDGRYWSATHTPVLDAHGQVAYVLQNTMDVTEFQRLKAELQQARRLGEEPAAPAAGALPLEQVENNVFARAQVIQRANRQLDGQRRHLLKLFEGKSLLRLSYERLRSLLPPEQIYVITGRSYLPAIAAELPELPAANLIAEPFPRDTAPAVGLAALYLR